MVLWKRPQQPRRGEREEKLARGRKGKKTRGKSRQIDSRRYYRDGLVAESEQRGGGRGRLINRRMVEPVDPREEGAGGS